MRIGRTGCRHRKLLAAALTALLLTAMLCGTDAWAAQKKAGAKSVQKKEKVHTLYWKATLRRDVKAKGKTFKRGTSVVVVNRRTHSKSLVRCRGVLFKAPNSILSIKRDMSTAKKGDYSKETKERFINGKKKASSKTRWLVWVSLDKQRVNVFCGSKGAWKLVKTFKCSTGKASTPTPPGWNTIDGKSYYFKGCKYYTEVCGSGMHKWPGAMNRKILGSHTVSHGCIRLTESSARWIYKNVPRKTKTYVY